MARSLTAEEMAAFPPSQPGFPMPDPRVEMVWSAAYAAEFDRQFAGPLQRRGHRAGQGG